MTLKGNRKTTSIVSVFLSKRRNKPSVEKETYLCSLCLDCTISFCERHVKVSNERLHGLLVDRNYATAELNYKRENW